MHLPDRVIGGSCRDGGAANNPDIRLHDYVQIVLLTRFWRKWPVITTDFMLRKEMLSGGGRAPGPCLSWAWIQACGNSPGGYKNPVVAPSSYGLAGSPCPLRPDQADDFRYSLKMFVRDRIP